MRSHIILPPGLRLRVAARRAAVCLCGLFALLIWAAHARAQYRFDHWTTDDGLPQNSVHGTLQTADGYMWFTTFDGLARFDGARFTVFNKNNSPGLTSNRIMTVYEDRFGDMWANLDTGGIARMHRGRFTTYTKEQGLPFDGVFSMCDDGQGNLVIFRDKRLFRWWEGRFQPFNELSQSAHQPSNAGLQRFHPADCWWDNDRWVCFSIGRTRSWAAAELPVQGIYGATMGDNGDYWFTSPKGVVRFSEGGVAQLYNERNGLPGVNPALVWGIGPRRLQAITRDAAGSLWVTDLYSMQSQLLSLRAPEGWDLNSNYGGFADIEGNYWFGTNGNGLFRARKQTVTAYTKAQGLNAREVYPLLEARDGSIWIGTRGDGFFRFKDGAFTSYTVPDLFGDYVTSLYEDRAGQIWVNGKSGSWRFTKGGLVQEISKEAAHLYQGGVWTMFEDRAGAYWIGSDGGVVRFQNGVATHYTTKDGLANDDTKVIIPDLTDGLWLGGDGGLTHYKGRKFTAWTEKDGLPGATVRALKQDGDGTLWIGTYDSGLGRFKDGRFTRYTNKDGLYDNGVFQILEDDYGWFWMSCNRGVYRVRKQELNDFADGKIKTITSLAYTRSDGMPSSQCNSGRWPAGIKTRDGKLWFPTMGGVAVIDPSSVKVNTKPPPVVIEEMRVDNQPVDLESWLSAIGSSAVPQSAFKILPGQENFEIRYTAISFINSENLKFKYKLEGLDHDWVDGGTRRTAYFSHVPPGDYSFKVISANSDGVWNTEGKSMRLSVLPPVYRTWWFLTLVALSLGGALGAIYKYRVTQLERAEAAQHAFSRQLIESQESERKRIAAELHDGLGQNLLVIKNRAQLHAMTLSDESSRNQFNDFGVSVTQTLEEVRAISQDLRPPLLDQLGLRTTIIAMIEKVAASSPIQFTHQLDDPDGLFQPGDEITIYRIVQESLNNILKHSGATEAAISIAVRSGLFALTIRDNGRGYTPDGDGPRAGLGLQGIAERARILGGSHEIHSAPGQGTTITVRIVLKDK